MMPLVEDPTSRQLAGFGAMAPDHWPRAKIGLRYEVALGKMLDSKRNIGGHQRPYLRNQDVQWGHINGDGLPTMRLEPGELARYTLATGDILVCEGGDVGRAAIWHGESGTTAFQKALHRLRPLKMTQDLPAFLVYLMQAAKAAGVFDRDDSRATISHLTAEAFRQYRFPFPPLEEQRRIAAFLDYETARIDELLSDQVVLGERLLERRHATTVAAASGELLGAELCASDLPWLEQQAAHWPSVRIRFVAKLGSGHTPSRSRPEYWEDCTIPWITTGEVSQIRADRIEYLVETRERISELGVRNSAAVVHPAGTVVLSRTASAGFSAIMGLDMATSQDFVAWTCGPRLRPRFLLLCLRAMRPDLLGRLAMGSTHKTIYFPDVESLQVPLPPVEEQDAAIEAAWTRLRDIDTMLDAIESAAVLLRERRSALITSAVTGQIDVSAWTPPDDWLTPEAA